MALARSAQAAEGCSDADVKLAMEGSAGSEAVLAQASMVNMLRLYPRGPPRLGKLRDSRDFARSVPADLVGPVVVTSGQVDKGAA